MIVKNMRASQGVLQAEVVVGQKDNGGNVTTLVKIDRRNPDLAEAFRSVENILLREAEEAIQQAVTRNARRQREAEKVSA